MFLESTSVTDHASYRPLACMFSIVIFMNNAPCIKGIDCVISHCTTPLMPTHDLCTCWHPLHLLAPTQFPPMPACTLHTCLHLFFPSCPLVHSNALHTACVNLFGKFTQWIYSENLVSKILHEFIWWNAQQIYLVKWIRKITQGIYSMKYTANVFSKFTQQIYSAKYLTNVLNEVTQQIYLVNLFSKFTLADPRFPKGAANCRGECTNCYFAEFLQKTLWKWKNLDQGGALPWNPLGSETDLLSWKF